MACCDGPIDYPRPRNKDGCVPQLTNSRDTSRWPSTSRARCTTSSSCLIERTASRRGSSGIWRREGPRVPHQRYGSLPARVRLHATISGGRRREKAVQRVVGRREANSGQVICARAAAGYLRRRLLPDCGLQGGLLRFLRRGQTTSSSRTAGKIVRVPEVWRRLMSDISRGADFIRSIRCGGAS